MNRIKKMLQAQLYVYTHASFAISDETLFKNIFIPSLPTISTILQTMTKKKAKLSQIIPVNDRTDMPAKE